MARIEISPRLPMGVATTYKEGSIVDFLFIFRTYLYKVTHCPVIQTHNKHGNNIPVKLAVIAIDLNFESVKIEVLHVSYKQ